MKDTHNASPNNGATDSCVTLSNLQFSGNGIVFVTISSLMLEFAMRSLAGSVNTAWVTAAITDLAPNASNALAPSTREPAVSTISSTMIQFCLLHHQ